MGGTKVEVVFTVWLKRRRRGSQRWTGLGVSGLSKTRSYSAENGSCVQPPSEGAEVKERKIKKEKTRGKENVGKSRRSSDQQKKLKGGARVVESEPKASHNGMRMQRAQKTDGREKLRPEGNWKARGVSAR